MSESFAQLFEESQVEQLMRPGAIVTGIVMAIGPPLKMVLARQDSLVKKRSVRNFGTNLKVPLKATRL